MKFISIVPFVCLVIQSLEIVADDQDVPEFRKVQVIQAWEKAQSSDMSVEALEALKQDLQYHEEKAWQMKLAQGLGGDKDGEVAQLRDELAEILTRHGLIERVPAKRTSEGADHRLFEDKRLTKLLLQAKQSGKFTDEELDTLRKEFGHYEDQVTEYRQLAEEIDQTNPDADAYHVKRLELKIKNREMSDNYKQLESLAQTTDYNEFLDGRVRRIWSDALASNFTDEELQTLKVELSHFEVKIQMYEEMVDRVMQAELDFYNDKSEGKDVDMSIHSDLNRQLRDMVKDVKTDSEYFDSRITSRRHDGDEL
ncbi:alpha-2-macroglobulin receptor-associated protein-like [Ptychodera flava]|uniref:alpha-2-macroglobulin receptor-associated protein-like n=1 Tax=Ptychodera flava TaxID=63121 RepID=UPI00396A0937